MRAEVAHVRVKRFGTGHRQHDGTHEHETLERRACQEPQAPERIERLEDRRLLPDLDRAERGDDGEPYDGHRPEETADQTGAAPLDREQHDQHHHGERDHIGIEERRGGLEPLDRAQHGDRRRDHAVAIEEGRAHQARHQQQTVARPTAARRAQGQRRQRQYAALATVVGAQDDDHVFGRHHHHERPRDERQHAQHILRRDAALGIEALPDGVERRGPDVAIDDAKCAQDQIVLRPLERLRAGVSRRLRHGQP